MPRLASSDLPDLKENQATSVQPPSAQIKLSSELKTWLKLVHQLQLSGLCFAIYRLPHQQQIHLVVSQEAQLFKSWAELTHKNGFVLVPFDLQSEHPIVLLQPEQHFEGIEGCNQGLSQLLAHLAATTSKLPSLSTAQPQPTQEHAQALAQAQAPVKQQLPQWTQYDADQRKANYHDSFAKIQAALHHDCNKLVLSRAAAFESGEHTDIAECFLHACAIYPNMMVTLSYTPHSGTWLGSTPEVLLSGFSSKAEHGSNQALASTPESASKAAPNSQPTHNSQQVPSCPAANFAESENEWYTMALAGTMPINNGVIPPLSAWSDKNRHEQAIVTQFLAQTLIPWASELHFKGPYSAQAGNLVHLKTDVRFKLENETNLPAVLNQLHPTPAVCGMPKDKAYEVIRQSENYDRSYYAGAIGLYKLDSSFARDSQTPDPWYKRQPNTSQQQVQQQPQMQAQQNQTTTPNAQTTQLFVNLRCMQFFGSNLAVCYAGGGILRESDEDSEFFETQKKMETMRSLLEQAYFVE